MDYKNNMKKYLFLFVILSVFYFAPRAHAQFACDDFTGTPIVSLASHTPTTYTGCSVAGFTWSGVGTGMQIVTSKQVSAVASDRTWMFQSGGTAPADANYTVQANFTAGAGKTSPGISVRWLTTGAQDTGYFVQHQANAWALWRSDGGNTQTAICTNFADVSDPTATRISLKASGTGATVTLLVQKDGVDIIGGTQSVCTDSSVDRITIVGRPGIVSFFSDNILTDQYLANWKATNAVATAKGIKIKGRVAFRGKIRQR